MSEEIDRMMFLRRLCIIFFLILCVLIATTVIIFVVMGSGDYGGENSDFAVVDDYGDIVKKNIDFEKSGTLYFFSEKYKSERTLFLDETPNLKIVNSDKYYLEVSAPNGLIDRLSVEMVEGCLVISFDESLYNTINTERGKYRGLYVNCEVFDVTVYAPINKLYTSAELTLDYEAPKADIMIIDVIGEVVEGRVYNVDARQLVCRLMGASTLEIAGKTTESTHLEAWHNSKILADELKAINISTSVQTQIFGFSYVSGEEFFAYNFIDMGPIITVGLVISMIAAAFLTVLFRVKFVKQRAEIDNFIEKVETEGNFLIKPEKNDENILQNDE